MILVLLNWSSNLPLKTGEQQMINHSTMPFQHLELI